jgi:hypothetical protein
VNLAVLGSRSRLFFELVRSKYGNCTPLDGISADDNE